MIGKDLSLSETKDGVNLQIDPPPDLVIKVKVQGFLGTRESGKGRRRAAVNLSPVPCSLIYSSSHASTANTSLMGSCMENPNSISSFFQNCHSSPYSKAIFQMLSEG